MDMDECICKRRQVKTESSALLFEMSGDTSIRSSKAIMLLGEAGKLSKFLGLVDEVSGAREDVGWHTTLKLLILASTGTRLEHMDN